MKNDDYNELGTSRSSDTTGPVDLESGSTSLSHNQEAFKEKEQRPAPALVKSATLPAKGVVKIRLASGEQKEVQLDEQALSYYTVADLKRVVRAFGVTAGIRRGAGR